MCIQYISSVHLYRYFIQCICKKFVFDVLSVYQKSNFTYIFANYAYMIVIY